MTNEEIRELKIDEVECVGGGEVPVFYNSADGDDEFSRASSGSAGSGRYAPVRAL